MSFLVRPTCNGFRVIEQTRENRKTVIKTVPIAGYAALGFRQDMSLAEAKARAKQINAQKSLIADSISGAVRRVEKSAKAESVYLPKVDTTRFESELKEMYLDNAYRLEITLRYWRAAKRCILFLGLDPKDFHASSPRFLNYFKSKKWSHDYVKRITRVLDLWGHSVCRFRGSRYEPLPKLTSVQVQKIHEVHEDKKDVRVPATPLPWVVLKNARDKFESEGLLTHWNWMFIATWFGLRPLEVDNLKNSKMYRIETDHTENVEVLWVYQSKLVSIERDKRWKPIPAFLKEQKLALQVLRSGEFKRPLNKTLRRLLDGPYETYSPRKAFVDLMLDAGVGLESIATFMGHQKIEMTWKSYKNRQKFKLPKSS